MLRALRLARLFRIFKLGRYSTAIKLMASCITGSMQMLSVLLFIMFIGVILFSSIMYYMERLSCPDTSGWDRTRWTTYADECENSIGGLNMARNEVLCCDQYLNFIFKVII